MSATTETPRPEDAAQNGDDISASSYAEDGQGADNGLDILASAIHGYPDVPHIEDDEIFAVDFYGDFQEPVIIGRGPSAHVDLGAEERRISKKHVVVDYVPELQIFQLQCLGVNSCRVNGHIETRRCPPTILENGDIIEIDGKLLRFQFPLVSPPEPRFVPKRASVETYEDISVKRRRLATQLAEEIAGTPPPPPVEEVLSPEDLVRPNVSWANLIVAAFQASGKQYLLVAQIYEQISRAHAFFRAQKNNNWKNAVRHALSVHSIFYRVNENEYKGGFWGYKPSDKPLKEKPSAAKKHEEVFHITQSQIKTEPGTDEGAAQSAAKKPEATPVVVPPIVAVEEAEASPNVAEAEADAETE